MVPQPPACVGKLTGSGTLRSTWLMDAPLGTFHSPQMLNFKVSLWVRVWRTPFISADSRGAVKSPSTAALTTAASPSHQLTAKDYSLCHHGSVCLFNTTCD